MIRIIMLVSQANTLILVCEILLCLLKFPVTLNLKNRYAFLEKVNSCEHMVEAFGKEH